MAELLSRVVDYNINNQVLEPILKFRGTLLDKRKEFADALGKPVSLDDYADSAAELKGEAISLGIRAATIHVCSNRLRLRLNPIGDKHLLQLILELEAEMGYFGLIELQKPIGMLLAATRQCLKTEWERVKAGEPFFRGLKLFLTSLVGVLGLSVAVIVLICLVNMVCSYRTWIQG